MCKTISARGLFLAASLLTAPMAAHADVIYQETWTNVNISGTLITGSFLFDPVTQAVSSDLTAISNPALCSAGSCGTTFGNPATVSFNGAGMLSAVGANLFNFAGPVGLGFDRMVSGSDFNYGELSIGEGSGLTGTLFVAAPAPAPSTGYSALIALAGAALWFSRDRFLRATGR